MLLFLSTNITENFSFQEGFSETRSKVNIELQVKYSLLLSYFNEFFYFFGEILKFPQYSK